MTTELAVHVVSGVLLLAGSFFLIVGAVGLLRMPDVFTRMHATSVSDTMGAGLLILGMIVEAGFTLVSVKLLVILVVFFFTGPLATHALARGALSVGLHPVLFDRGGRKRVKELELIDEFKLVEATPQAAARKTGVRTSAKKPAARKPAAKKPASRKSSAKKGGPSSKR